MDHEVNLAEEVQYFGTFLAVVRNREGNSIKGLVAQQKPFAFLVIFHSILLIGAEGRVM